MVNIVLGAVLGVPPRRGELACSFQTLAGRPGVAPLLAGTLLACRGVGAQWGDGSTSRALGSHIALWLAGIVFHLINYKTDNTKH